MKTTKVLMQLTALGRIDDHYVVMGERFCMGRPELFSQRISEKTYTAFQQQLSDARVDLTEEPVTTAKGEGHLDRLPSADDITSQRVFAVVSGRAQIEESKRGRLFTMLEKGVLEGPKLDLAVELENGFAGESFAPRRKRITTLEALAYKIRGPKANIRMGTGYSGAWMRKYKASAELSQA